MASSYVALDPDCRSIRLLNLLPGAGHDVVHCTLKVADLDDHPRYEALSYVWGDLGAFEDIFLEGEPYRIGRSLALALRHNRDPIKTRTIWADALCINQQDDAEKATQVGLMHDIYRNCENCLIWLGCEDDESGLCFSDADAGFSMIQALVDFTARVWSYHDNSSTMGTYMDNGSMDDMEDSDCALTADKFYDFVKERFSRPGQVDAACRGLRGLLFPGNQWWNRAWTMQELALPRQRTMVWQTLSLPWQKFSRAALTWRDHGIAFEHFEGGGIAHDWGRSCSTITSLDYVIGEAEPHPSIVFQRARDRLASDPRDKVYGFLGLLRGWEREHTKCDYTLSTAKVYARLTLDLMELGNNFNPVLGLRGEPQCTPGIPSWALDLVRPRDLVNIGVKYWEHESRQHGFYADGRANIADTFYEYDDGDLSITLRGVCVDKVQHIDQGILVDERDVRPWKEFVAVLRRREELWSHFRQKNELVEHPVHGESIDDAIWHTALGGLITYGERRSRLLAASDQDFYDDFKKIQKYNHVGESLRSMILNQAFFITDRGFLGIGPPNVKAGDEAWIIYGSKVPILLRPRTDGSYTWLGDGYVHGVMFGQLTRSADPWSKLIIR